MAKSKKGGRLRRQKSALALLEAQLEKFKKAGEDKAPWITTRNGKKHLHEGKTFDQECSRINKQISILKEKIGRSVG